MYLQQRLVGLVREARKIIWSEALPVIGSDNRFYLENMSTVDILDFKGLQLMFILSRDRSGSGASI